MNVLVTGSAGLVGSAVVRLYCGRDADVTGIDNDLRGELFGREASTAPVAAALSVHYPNYSHVHADIRDNEVLKSVFRSRRFDLIVHAAAQPSHEWSARDPLTDFSVNAVTTIQLLECTRLYSPAAAFVFLSTNKVYGDRPNLLPFREEALRWDVPPDHPEYHGIDETLSIDGCMHSIFGSSKVSADIMTQEYGRYFGLRTAVFRCGCITGGSHAGNVLHGFLSHLVRCVALGKPYSIIGYGGKQVRDNLHADDLARAIEEFRLCPRAGAVYNMGGGRERSVSVLEALNRAAIVTGKTPVIEAVTTEPRRGDHLWYITSTAAFMRDYPSWQPVATIDDMMEDIARNAGNRASARAYFTARFPSSTSTPALS